MAENPYNDMSQKYDAWQEGHDARNGEVERLKHRCRELEESWAHSREWGRKQGVRAESAERERDVAIKDRNELAGRLLKMNRPVANFLRERDELREKCYLATKKLTDLSLENEELRGRVEAHERGLAEINAALDAALARRAKGNAQ